MSYKELMRRKLLEDMYEKLSPDERRIFFEYTMQNKNHEEIMDALKKIGKKADDNHHSFTGDFLANVAGNAVWDGIVYFLSRLIRK